MDVAALAAGLDHARIVGDPQTEIRSLACDTRRVEPGALFFCIRGQRADGHDYAPQALAAGAVALVCERPLEVAAPQLIVPRARRAMALVSARFYGDPTSELRVAAVTGTNGKTTTAHLLAAVLAAGGARPALLGTVVNRIAGVESPVTLTTAESLDLQRMFRDMVDGGDDACVMEASSHALYLDRTAGIDFDAVLFTNLTRDHLDFHVDLEQYFLAKRLLFLPDEERQPHAVAVINAGDEFGRRLVEDCRRPYGADLWTYAVEGDCGEGEVDFRAVDLALAADRSAFTLVSPRAGVRERVEVALPARFNVANALAAAACALALDVPGAAVVAGLSGAGGVPGRVEPVQRGQPFSVLVDYSHTPDSLANALREVRAVTSGRLLCVFGCGGDRDKGKRSLMGAVAAELADLAVVTSDNPRSEDPQAIIGQILEGVAPGERSRVLVEPDRRAAIGLAVRRAAPGDAVLIAGKGHETYQILGDRTIDFDDRAVAAAALAEIGFDDGPGSPRATEQGAMREGDR